MLCSSAYSPAAARMPACRMPPPSSLRARIEPRQELGPAEHQRPHRRPQTLGETHADGVAGRRDLGQRHAGGHVGVPDAGAVQMQQQAVAVAEPAHSQDLLQGIDEAAAVVVRVLQRDDAGGRPVRIRLRVHVLLHGVGIERAVGGIEAAQLQAAEGRRAALLVVDDVGVGVQEELIAAPCLRVQRRLVGLRAAGEVERRLLAEELPPYAPGAG